MTAEIYSQFNINDMHHRAALYDAIEKVPAWGGSARLILRKLVKWGWQNGTEAYNHTIAHECGFSLSTINNTIRKFRDLGVFQIEKAQSHYRKIKIQVKKLLELVYVPTLEEIEKEVEKENPEIKKQEEKELYAQKVIDFSEKLQSNPTILHLLDTYNQKFILPTCHTEDRRRNRLNCLFKILFDQSMDAVSRGYMTSKGAHADLWAAHNLLKKAIDKNNYRIERLKFVTK